MLLASWALCSRWITVFSAAFLLPALSFFETVSKRPTSVLISREPAGQGRAFGFGLVDFLKLGEGALEGRGGFCEGQGGGAQLALLDLLLDVFEDLFVGLGVLFADRFDLFPVFGAFGRVGEGEGGGGEEGQ